jgi:ABC-type nitrate/sulfonate/bicarbonate transport system permease component
MQLNNPIFINQTDADIRYVNTTGDGINGILNVVSGIFTSGIDLNNSNLINATPQIINLSANFNISGNYNSRMIMVNSATEVTGSIISGNSLGFNASVTQVGAGKIFITGSGIGVSIGSYGNQYRTAGQFAAISLLHTGSNGYTMYGNTAA